MIDGDYIGGPTPRKCNHITCGMMNCSFPDCHSIPKDSWVEKVIAEFAANFAEKYGPTAGDSVHPYPVPTIQAWLRQTLTAHNKQIRENVEKIRKENCYSGRKNKHKCDSVCEALQTSLSLLEE